MKPFIEVGVCGLVLACFCSCTSSVVTNSVVTNRNSNVAEGRCRPVELVVPVPEGGYLVSSVTINRDENGYIDTKWKTSFPAGTRTSIMLHLLNPGSKKGAEEGPLLDGVSREKTSCDGKLITQSTKLSNAGAGFNKGQYWLDLGLAEDSPRLNEILASAKGKVKGISRFGNSLLFDVSATFELPNCEGLPETLPKSTPAPLTKEGAEAIARSLSARSMESKMAQQGLPAKITVSGLDNTVITIESANFTSESVTRQAGNTAYMAPFRKMRFKRVVFTNGSEEWGYDLK